MEDEKVVNKQWKQEQDIYMVKNSTRHGDTEKKEMEVLSALKGQAAR